MEPLLRKIVIHFEYNIGIFSSQQVFPLPFTGCNSEKYRKSEKHPVLSIFFLHFWTCISIMKPFCLWAKILKGRIQSEASIFDCFSHFSLISLYPYVTLKLKFSMNNGMPQSGIPSFFHFFRFVLNCFTHFSETPCTI